MHVWVNNNNYYSSNGPIYLFLPWTDFFLFYVIVYNYSTASTEYLIMQKQNNSFKHAHENDQVHVYHTIPSVLHKV